MIPSPFPRLHSLAGCHSRRIRKRNEPTQCIGRTDTRYALLFKFRKWIITFQPSLPSAGAGLVPAHKQCSTYFKRSWDIILRPAQDRPLRSVRNLRNLSTLLYSGRQLLYQILDIMQTCPLTVYLPYTYNSSVRHLFKCQDLF